MFPATSDRKPFFPVRGRLCNSAIETSDNNSCNNRKKTNATRKYYLLQHQNNGYYNIKFIQLQHESVAFMKSAGEEEGYPMATPIPTLTS
jgi:hypothetical protein